MNTTACCGRSLLLSLPSPPPLLYLSGLAQHPGKGSGLTAVQTRWRGRAGMSFGRGPGQEQYLPPPEKTKEKKSVHQPELPLHPLS